MVIREKNKSNPNLYEYHSDRGYYVQLDNTLYRSIVIPETDKVIETNIPIPEETLSDNDLYKILAGSDLPVTDVQARALRQTLLKSARNLSDEEALSIQFFFPKWDVGQQYHKDDRVEYNTILYKVLYDNITGDINDLPSVSTNYYRIPVPVSMALPYNSEKIYQKNERVTYGGFVYESSINNNTWSPIEFGWHQV